MVCGNEYAPVHQDLYFQRFVYLVSSFGCVLFSNFPVPVPVGKVIDISCVFYVDMTQALSFPAAQYSKLSCAFDNPHAHLLLLLSQYLPLLPIFSLLPVAVSYCSIIHYIHNINKLLTFVNTTSNMCVCRVSQMSSDGVGTCLTSHGSVCAW